MIVDLNLDFLKSAATLVDVYLERLDRESGTSPDPDAFGAYDEIEYFIGFGFVACQTYLTAMASQSGLKGKKDKALALGPKHRTGQPMVRLVNAAANYWKHSPEWSLDIPTTQTNQTLEVISILGIDTSGSYPLANILHEIVAPHPARVASLLPFIVQWRNTLPR